MSRTTSVITGSLFLASGLSIAAAEDYEVGCGSFYYEPKIINVLPGDTIRWVWEGGFHNVTSGDECGLSNNLFQSPFLSSSNTSWEWQVPATASGFFEYFCDVGGHCFSGNQYGVVLIDAGTVHEVSTNGLAFEPANITVQEGDVVVFENGGGSHDVTFGSNCVADGGFFGTLTNTNPLLIWQVPTGTAGTVQNYFCSPHCGFGMVGSITIEAGDSDDCPEDITGDGIIGVDDLLTLLSQYGQECPDCGDSDIDGDGTVSVNDLLALLAAYGQPC